MADDELVSPPEWLTKEYLGEILKIKKNDPKLKVVHIQGATMKGDNYSSVMSRATHTNQGNEQRVIVKTMPTTNVAIQYVEHQKLFPTEIKMLEEFIPAAEKVLEPLGEDSSLAPHVYFTQLTPNPIIIMEDLCETKFNVVNRHEGCNLDQSLAIIKKLAELHVSSKILLKNNREMFEDFMNGGFWGSDNRQITQMMLASLRIIVDNVDSWSNEKWSDDLRPLQKTITEDFYKLFDTADNDVPLVLTHGDAWTNNIMLRYRGCGTYDVRFVDLQMSSVRSPVYDIMYFIFTSPRNDIIIKEIEIFLKTYHNHWCQLHDILGEQNDFSYEDLLRDFKRKLLFGFAMMFSTFAVTCAKKEDAPDTSEAKEVMDERLFKNKHYQEGLLLTLPYFKTNGLFVK